MSMLTALERKKVDIVLVDTFSLNGLTQTLKGMNLKIAEMIDTQSGYGVVLGGMTTSLQADIQSQILAREASLTSFISDLKKKLPVRDYLARS